MSIDFNNLTDGERSILNANFLKPKAELEKLILDYRAKNPTLSHPKRNEELYKDCKEVVDFIQSLIDGGNPYSTAVGSYSDANLKRLTAGMGFFFDIAEDSGEDEDRLEIVIKQLETGEDLANDFLYGSKEITDIDKIYSTAEHLLSEVLPKAENSVTPTAELEKPILDYRVKNLTSSHSKRNEKLYEHCKDVVDYLHRIIDDGDPYSVNLGDYLGNYRDDKLDKINAVMCFLYDIPEDSGEDIDRLDIYIKQRNSSKDFANEFLYGSKEVTDIDKIYSTAERLLSEVLAKEGASPTGDAEVRKKIIGLASTFEDFFYIQRKRKGTTTKQDLSKRFEWVDKDEHTQITSKLNTLLDRAGDKDEFLLKLRTGLLGEELIDDWVDFQLVINTHNNDFIMEYTSASNGMDMYISTDNTKDNINEVIRNANDFIGNMAIEMGVSY